MDAKKLAGVWAVAVGLFIASSVIWAGMYSFASGYIGNFWE